MSAGLLAAGGAVLGLGSTIGGAIGGHFDRVQDWEKHEDTIQQQILDRNLEYAKLNTAKLKEYSQMREAGINIGATGAGNQSLTYSNSAKSSGTAQEDVADVLYNNAAKLFIKSHLREFKQFLKNNAKLLA